MRAIVLTKEALIKILCIFAALFFVSGFIMTLPVGSNSFEPQIKSSSLTENTVEDGNIKRTEYLDSDGNITYASDKHYAVLITTLDEGRRLDEYFDAEGNPTIQTSGHYALLREYNDAGKIWRQTYLGTDGQPIINKSGYSIFHRYYYEDGPFEGKIENDFYFDTQENPIKLSLGQYGVHKEYDEEGRNSVLTYLDADGQPMLTNKGYSTVIRTFDENNKIRTERYYDLDGNPVSLAKGQYGILRENGVVTYLDEDGNEFFVLSSYLLANSVSVIILGCAVVLISMLGGKKVNFALLAVYLVFIFYMTLMYRESGASKAKLELFWSYRQFFTSKSIRQEILNNVWLFIPLGAIIARLKKKARYLVLPILLSVIIEVVQYMTGFGLAEFDDVISNTLGALIGWGINKIIRNE